MTKQYMKYIEIGGVASEVNKELEKDAKVVLMVPLLKTDNWGSRTAGYNVLFEKEEESAQLSPEQYKIDLQCAYDCAKSAPLTDEELFKRIRKQYGIEETACCFISVHNPGQPEPPLYIATDWGKRKVRRQNEQS
jgi:hypothetical protein